MSRKASSDFCTVGLIGVGEPAELSSLFVSQVTQGHTCEGEQDTSVSVILE